jgi:hypothetical protein
VRFFSAVAVMNDKCDCSTSYFFPHRKKNCTLEKLMKTAGLISTPEPSKSSEPNSEALIGTIATDATKHIDEKLPAAPMEANLEGINDDYQNNLGCEDDQLGMAVVLASSHLDDSEGVCEAWVVVDDDDALTPRVTENESILATDVTVDVEKMAVSVAHSSDEKTEKCCDEKEGKKVIDEKEKIFSTDTVKTCQAICVRKEDNETQLKASAILQLDTVKVEVPMQKKVVEGPIGLPGNKSSIGHVIIEATEEDVTTGTEREHQSKSQAIPILPSTVKATAVLPVETANIGNRIDGVDGQIKQGAIEDFHQKKEKKAVGGGGGGGDLFIVADGADRELLKLCDQQGSVNVECVRSGEKGDEVGKEERKVEVKKEEVKEGQITVIEVTKEVQKEVQKEEKEVQKLLCGPPVSVPAAVPVPVPQGVISAASIREETSEFLNSHTAMPSPSPSESQEVSGEEKALQAMCTCSTAVVFPHRMGKCAARMLVSGLKGGVENCIQYIGDLDPTDRDRDRVVEDVR